MLLLKSCICPEESTRSHIVNTTATQHTISFKGVSTSTEKPHERVTVNTCSVDIILIDHQVICKTGS